MVRRQRRPGEARLHRLKIFAKGNLDVRDALLFARSGPTVLWNGINEIGRRQGWVARVRHETYTRSDALLAATGEVPASVSRAGLSLGAFSAESQFSDAIFKSDAEVIVLSIMSDVMNNLARHRSEGFLFYPYDSEQPGDRAWFKQHLELLGPLDFDRSMADLIAVIERVRSGSDASILIFNMSSFVPGERVFCYSGLAETSATRIRRFNLGLTEVSAQTGVSIVDVDAIVAQAGAGRLKLDTVHVTAEGARLIAEQVVHILQSLGRVPVEDAAWSA